jgi:hypothetical protein
MTEEIPKELMANPDEDLPGGSIVFCRSEEFTIDGSRGRFVFFWDVGVKAYCTFLLEWTGTRWKRNPFFEPGQVTGPLIDPWINFMGQLAPQLSELEMHGHRVRYSKRGKKK